MALARHPALRTLGDEPDEVKVEVTVTGKRVNKVLAALAAAHQFEAQVIPVMISVDGLDSITGGLLGEIEVSGLDGRMGGTDEVQFTIVLTEEV